MKSASKFFTEIRFILKRHRKQKWNLFIFLAFASPLMLVTSGNRVLAQEIPIVKHHVGRAEIIISTTASSQIKRAAKILQDIIKQSTRAIITIDTIPKKNLFSINIGETDFVNRSKIDLSKLDEDGYLLQTVDADNFVIVGGSDWGTEFGIYAFLERYLGVTWLMPSSIGTEISSYKNLTVPQIKILENPTYLSREIWPIDIEKKNDLDTWGRFNRAHARLVFTHNLRILLAPTEFYKTNPDFYPKGITQQTLSGFQWQPNFSAPGIADSASDKIIRYFKQNPNATSYSLGINDYTKFDQSPQSLKRRIGKKNYLGLENVSNDYFKWVNAVAENVKNVFPEKKLGLLAYNNVAEPPSFPISSNVVPYLTFERLRWSDTALERQGHELTERWEKLCPSIGWYDYTWGYNYLVPRVWFHEMQKYLQWGSTHHAKYYFAELDPNWGEGPKPWIQLKLLWNPYYNVDSLLNIWYVKTGGKRAAKPLKEFYQIWETFWSVDIFSSKWNTDRGQYLPFNDFSYLDAVPENYIEELDRLMNKAFRYAKTDLQKQRVGELKKMWEVYKMAIELYQQADSKNKLSILANSSDFIALLNQLHIDSLFTDTIDRIKKTLKIK